ncbi:MAG TPA: sugar phosphate nucleotidyltransferase, partial [Steroidobacteraceae bacterium]|nr:sugar phosphate nucleotidyltransferase [Steroidobacteraceae bacterium]
MGDGPSTKPWALILAAGDGTRLRELTTAPSGTAIPKQFCALRCGPTLLDAALARAAAVASSDRTCVVVAKDHRYWWEPQLRALPAANIIVQPRNRGTANGILLPLLGILQRDAGARLVLLPSDHHVSEEEVLARALRRGVEQLRWRGDAVTLLGIEPEMPDPQLGYIVPGPGDGCGAFEVIRFVEKPGAAQAREEIARGALWNAFILISTARALLDLFWRRSPQIVTAMREALRRAAGVEGQGSALDELYEKLPTIDFSRDVLQSQEARLRVLPVPSCGWSDLGTPERVAVTLRRTPAPRRDRGFALEEGHWSLAAQQERLLGRSIGV